MGRGHTPPAHRTTPWAARVALRAVQRDEPGIILDLPPLLAPGAVLAILQQADATLLVIEEGITPGQDIPHSVNMLAGIPPAGMVLNKARNA
jgi:hypothetical protein